MSDPTRRVSEAQARARPTGVSRREALKVIAAGVGAVAGLPALSEAAWAQAMAVWAQAAAEGTTGLKFFTVPEHRTVDVLSEIIIPADDRSPGASAAKVADFIDLLLSGASREEHAIWREGLASLDAVTTTRWGKAFAGCTSDEQTTILTEISRHETDPQTPLEKLFVEVKGRTIQGYYTSEIGIHKELKYKGNQSLAEFVGCTHPEHTA